MKILIYKHKNFEVYDTVSSLVVINTLGDYENHAHLTRCVDKHGKIKISVAKTLIDIVIKKRVPHSSYLLTSAMRLTTDIEYKKNLQLILEKRRSKKYINNNKGVRKWD